MSPKNIVISKGYKSFDQDNKQEMLSSYGSTLNEFDGLKTQANPVDIVTDVNVRAPFTRFDYEFFRPNESLPRNFRQAIYACRGTYLHVGVIRNVIDMMTDFACEDLKLIHSDKKIEAFYKVWAKKVKLEENATEFARHLMVDGNVVVKRVTAKLTKPIKNDWENRSVAAADIKLKKQQETLEANEIPWRYIFLNVAVLQAYGGLAARMAGKPQLGYHVSQELSSAIRSSDPEKQKLIEELPLDIREQILKGGTPYIKLDMTKLHVAYNKKDYWDTWAQPPLMAIISDVRYKQKLKQMELAAADGFINVIRIWKLGDHKEGILPDETAVRKLINILNANVGGGAMDIVWDTLIDMKDYYPPLDRVLDKGKFEEVDKDILIGLGVPEVLVGGSGGGNFSNSWIQLKTLVEKLQYVRSKIREWIIEELEIVAKAMDFDSIPRIQFNEMNLQDESIKQKLIISLLDRNVISVEAVLDTFGEDFLFEVERIKQEAVVLDKSNIERVNPLDQQKNTMGGENPENKGGRPPLTKDSSTRQARTPKVRTKGDLLFALEAIDAIDEHIIPLYMTSFNVDNARKLTAEQKNKINSARSYTLACIKPEDDLSVDSLIAISSDKTRFNISIIKEINKQIADFMAKNSEMPTLTQRKHLEVIAWCEINNKEDGE